VPSPKRTRVSVTRDTPTLRRVASVDNADKGDANDKSYKREGVGSGRGGFSVKGAASAAARARWEKVRRAKAERGEESDDGEKRKAKDKRRETKATSMSMPGGFFLLPGLHDACHADVMQWTRS
jgi:hypothetical protein